MLTVSYWFITKAKLTDEEFAVFESARDRTPARTASFE